MEEQELFCLMKLLSMSSRDISNSVWILQENSPSQIIYSNTLALLEIYGNYHYLETVLINLLDNARKYSLPNTVIDVHCQREGGEVVIRIRNSCRDIRAEEVSLLFEKYHQGSNSGGTAGNGVGLVAGAPDY